MWPFSSPRPRRQAPQARLQVEQLEHRDCPSGGQLVSTFNGTGMESVNFGVNGTAIQADGKILAVGSGYFAAGSKEVEEIVVQRLNPNGSLDKTFNGTGEVDLRVAAVAVGTAVAVQPNGQILVGGYASLSNVVFSDTEFVVARLNTNGSLDSSFGNQRKGGGEFLYNPTASREGVDNLAVLSDGSIIAGGYSSAGPFTALKLTSSGTLDPTFGTGGLAATGVGPGTSSVTQTGMAITASNEVVLCGYATAPSADGLNHPHGALVVFTAAGQLDTSFNGAGYLLAAAPGETETDFYAVTMQGNNIVAAGEGANLVGTGYKLSGLVARFGLDGTLDATFATSGYFTAPTVKDFRGVATAADGSLVVGGNVSDTTTHTVVIHLSTAGILDTTFGPNGDGFSYATNSTMMALSVGVNGDILTAGGGGLALFTGP